MIYENEIVSNTHPNNQILKLRIQICNEMLTKTVLKKGFHHLFMKSQENCSNFVLTN